MKLNITNIQEQFRLFFHYQNYFNLSSDDIEKDIQTIDPSMFKNLRKSGFYQDLLPTIFKLK